MVYHASPDRIWSAKREMALAGTTEVYLAGSLRYGGALNALILLRSGAHTSAQQTVVIILGMPTGDPASSS